MIYFIRHGESEANVLGVFAGQKDDSPLTKKGIEQAKEAAANLTQMRVKIDRIISSPLQRAFCTAEIIATAIDFDVLKIETDSRIAEYDMGSITGTPIRNITGSEMVAALGAEDPALFRKRVMEFFRDLGNSKNEQNILVVSHAGVGRMLETIKNGLPPEAFYDIPGIKNATIALVDWM